MRFVNANERGFERTIRADDPFWGRYDAPMTVSEIIDLKMCIQSLVADKPHQLGRLPLNFNKFTLLEAVAFPSPEDL